MAGVSVAHGAGRDDVRLLRTLLDELPALIAYWDADSRNVVANHAYLDYFGLDPGAVHGMHIREVLGADLYAKNLPFIEAALAGVEQLFDRTIVDVSGHARHTQASYVPDVVDGEVNGFFVLVTDVTPRVEAQRAMDRAEAIARLGSWELDVASGVVTWSRNLHQLVGVDPAGGPELLTLPGGMQHVHADDRDRVRANLELAVRTGDAYTTGYRVLTAEGEREVVSHGVPSVTADGRVTRVSGTIQDVTEVKAAARDLARVNLELRRANELNADVIAMLGHDLRTSLFGVVANLENLEAEWDSVDDDERRRSVARARMAALRLGALIQRIMSLAAIDAGSVQPRVEDLDLAEVLTEIARESGLPGEPTLEIDPTAPPSVAFDRLHLQQILENLLTNAFRYGAEPVRIVVSGAPDQVDISVTDAGAGVAPDEVGALFTRFARTGRRQLAAGGTGFGLYMSAQLAGANEATLSHRPARDGRPHAFVLSIPAH